MPSPDYSRIFQSLYRLNVMAVQAVARLMAASQAHVEHVVVLVGFERSRVFSLSNAHVMPARAWARLFPDPCRTCGGEGRVQRAKTLAVSIPPGVDTGTRIRLSGKGEAGLRGGPAGDLYIFVNVDPHAIFARDGGNLHARIPLPMTVAALGGSIDVPTLEGKMARLTIEAGTQSGRKFRMRGKGMPALRRGNTGDQIIEVQVETPTNLNKKAKRAS
jgi:molecular chaperone DnaJ